MGLIAIAVTLSVAITMSIVNKSYNQILKDLPAKIERYSVLDEIGAVVNSYYYKAVKSDDIDSALARGYISGLDDKYSVYMTSDEYEQYQAKTQGSMTGIGVEYSQSENGYVSIDSVYSGSPAQTGGLKAGDLIVAFDGEAVNSSNYESMISKLIGDKLTTVNLTYRRDGVEKTISVVKGYEAKSVIYTRFEKIGYIRISNFYSTTAKQVEDAVDKLLNAEVIGIVIDLRGNNSANFQESLDTLDIFIPMVEGADGVAKLVDADNNVKKIYTSTSGSVNIPMAVLINSKTAGAAELLACELRDFDKAELVGNATTAGMDLVQEVVQLTGGSAVRLSVGRIVPYGSSGYSAGVMPDYEVDKTSVTDVITEDSQYLYAASLLTPDNDNE